MSWNGLPTIIEEVDFSGLPESVARTVRPAIERQSDAVIAARIGLHDLAVAGAVSEERVAQMQAIGRCETCLYRSLVALREAVDV